MRLLLRMAFWLSVILLLLPSSGGSQRAANVSATDALSAAKAIMADLRSFCERQREACAIGSLVVVAIGHRAQAGAKMIYDYLTDRFGPAETDAMGSVSNARSMPQSASGASNDTLLPADRVPNWRAPQARSGLRDRPA
jgi:hypothetical protein